MKQQTSPPICLLHIVFRARGDSLRISRARVNYTCGGPGQQRGWNGKSISTKCSIERMWIAVLTLKFSVQKLMRHVSLQTISNYGASGPGFNFERSNTKIYLEVSFCDLRANSNSGEKPKKRRLFNIYLSELKVCGRYLKFTLSGNARLKYIGCAMEVRFRSTSLSKP